MPNRCSVLGCKSGERAFEVREEWIDLNPLGWKNVKSLAICENHFLYSDICRGGPRVIVRKRAKPVNFSAESLR